MTFILPDDKPMSSFDGFVPGWSSMWSAWTSGFSPSAIQESLSSYSSASMTMLDHSMKLMLLPLTVLPVSANALTPAPIKALPAAPIPAPEAAVPAEVPAVVVAKTIEPLPVAPAPAPAETVVAFAGAMADDTAESAAPKLLSKPDGAPDNLILIKGIGPKLNQLLNSLGVWHFRQIVSWTPAEVAWVNAKIDFNGRIQRESWQQQAAELMKTSKAA